MYVSKVKKSVVVAPESLSQEIEDAVGGEGRRMGGRCGGGGRPGWWWYGRLGCSRRHEAAACAERRLQQAVPLS